MSAAVTIFMAQAAMVFLLGFQSLSVHGRHYIMASIGSLFLGVTGYQITAIIAHSSLESVGSLVWVAYVVAGPIGITASMYLHPRIKAMLDGNRAKRTHPITEGATRANVKSRDEK